LSVTYISSRNRIKKENSKNSINKIQILCSEVVNNRELQISDAHSQLSQTSAEDIGFFYLVDKDNVKKELAEHTFVLLKIIYFVF